MSLATIFAEINWIGVVIFAIAILSQLFDFFKKKKIEPEEPIPERPPSRPEQNQDLDALLESMGIPKPVPRTEPPPVLVRSEPKPKPQKKEVPPPPVVVASSSSEVEERSLVNYGAVAVSVETPQHPFRKKYLNPGGIRDAILLQEILGPPKCQG